MSRRTFLRAACMAPLLAAGGCRFSFEQGVFSDCRAVLDAATRSWVEAAWEGLRPERVWDVHAHVFGNGLSGAGIFVGPELDRPVGPGARARRAFFMNGGCVGEDDAGVDQRMVARLAALADQLPPGARVMLMAFDATYDLEGRQVDAKTGFNVPNEYARRVAEAKPARFEWIASVHPYRADAIEELERCKAGGARAVKWLPPAMGINPASPRCTGFFESLARLDLPLITHAGEEQAVPGARDHPAANPLHLRHPLERGVRVVAAHCATLGESEDLERAGRPSTPNFELFSRLMAEKRYEGWLFGDLSAVTQANRIEWLGPLLARREWAGRLLNGSDYPLPGILPLFSIGRLVSDGLLDERLVPALRSLRESNALLFDFVLKRNLRAGPNRLPVAAFETRGFFVQEGRGEGHG